MRKNWVVAATVAAVTVMSGVAQAAPGDLAQAGLSSQDQQRLADMLAAIGKMAYHFGACEHYIPKDQADQMFLAMSGGNDSDQASAAHKMVSETTTKSYAEGRTSPEAKTLSDQDCAQLLSSDHQAYLAVFKGS